MNIHVRCDMEGVGGVVSMAQVTPGSPEYIQGQEWFMLELLALIEGLVSAGGVQEVSIYDEHWFGRNIDIRRIPSRVRLFLGKPPYRKDWAGGLDASHDAMILHGLHAMAGTGHVLAHTYEPDFCAIHLNGLLVGEIGVESAIAGDWGVPLGLIIADSAGVEEAQALLPGVRSVITKISHGESSAECFPLIDILHEIKKAGYQLAKDGPCVKPWTHTGEAEMRFTFNDGRYLEVLSEHYKNDFIAGNVLQLTGLSATAIWADYWQRKLFTQKFIANNP